MKTKATAIWGLSLMVVLFISLLSIAVYCDRASNPPSSALTIVSGGRYSIAAVTRSLTGMAASRLLGNISPSTVSPFRDGMRYLGQDAHLKKMGLPRWGKIRRLRWKGGGESNSSFAKMFSLDSISDAIQIMSLVLLGMVLVLFGGSAIMKYAAKASLSYDRPAWINGRAFLAVAAVFASGLVWNIAVPLKVPVSLLSILIAVGSLGLLVFGVGVLFSFVSSLAGEFSIARKIKNGLIMTGLGMVFISFGIWFGMTSAEPKDRLAGSSTVAESSLR